MPSWEGTDGQTIGNRKLKRGEEAGSMEQGRRGSCSLGRFSVFFNWISRNEFFYLYMNSILVYYYMYLLFYMYILFLERGGGRGKERDIDVRVKH